MAEQRTLIKLEQGPKPPPEPTPPAALKLKTPNRNQFTFAAVDVEALLGPDHPARAIWELAGRRASGWGDSSRRWWSCRKSRRRKRRLRNASRRG